MLISPEYQALNEAFHKAGGFRGSIDKYWAPIALDLIEKLGTRDILDYGCGASPISQYLGFPIQEYDPAVPGKTQSPQPADIVLTGCLLAHIEPKCLDNVLNDLRRCTRIAGLFVIAHEAAAEDVLANGQNAHIITEPWEWWWQKLTQHGFTIQGAQTVSITIRTGANDYVQNIRQYERRKTFVLVGGDKPARIELARE